MAKRTRAVGKPFTALGDDGLTYTLQAYEAVLDAGSMDDPDAELPGLRSLKTSDGLSVNRRQKGEYEIVQTGVVLRSDSPNAP